MSRLIASFVSILYLVLVVLASPTTDNEQLVLSPPSLSDKWSWSDCGGPDDVVSVNSIQISPDPPKPGENLTVIASGMVLSEITQGTKVTVEVKIGTIRLLNKELDICDEAQKADAEIQCPVKEGDYTVEQTVPLPNAIPQAAFNVHVTGVTANEEPLLCLDLKVDFRNSLTKLFM